MEKFDIERVYWELRGVDWGIVTENEIDLIYAANIEIVHYYYWIDKLHPLTQESILHIEAMLTPKVIRENLPLKNLTNDCDKQLGLSPGTSSKVVLHLIANRRWQVDMSKPINLHKRMTLVSAQNTSQQ